MSEYFHDELQEQIVKRLRADSALAGLEVHHEDEKDLVQTITVQLKKLGLCVVVSAPVEDCSSANLPAPVYDNVQIAVDVVENVLLNRAATGTQKPCKQIAKAVLAALWHFRAEGFAGVLYPGKPAIANVPDREYVIYRVQLKIGE